MRQINPGHFDDVTDAVFRSNNKYCESQAGRYFGTLGEGGLFQDTKCGTRTSWSFGQGHHESLEICIDGDEGEITFSYLFFVVFLQVYVPYQDGPSMAAVMKVIGRETTLERLK